MRVLVCGGRNFDNYAMLKLGFFLFTSTGEKITEICHGGASGADSLADTYAKENNIPCKVYKPEWATYGKKAGPLRNRKMLQDFDPDLVLALPGGKGTKNMVELAEKSGYSVLELS